MSKLLGINLTATLFCLAIGACGGGGGSSPMPPSVSDQPSTNNPPSPVAGNNPAPTAPTSPQRDPTQARFKQPLGVAVDASGTLYIADSGNNTIRKLGTNGSVSTLAGMAGVSGNVDGMGSAARFAFLKGLAVDAARNVYAVDNNTVRKVTPAGVVTTLAGAAGVLGDADGPGATARFAHPWGIAAAADGTLFVADTGNNLVRKISADGMVSTLAGVRGGRGKVDGSTASATFLGPMGIARDQTGNLFVTDWYGPPAPNLLETSTFIREIAVDGTVSTLAGNFGGEQGPALFTDTFAIAVDANRNVYVAALNSVRRISASGTVDKIAGPGPEPGWQSLEGLAIDGEGRLYACDTSSDIISRIAQDGTVTVIAGKYGAAGATDVP